MTLGCNDNDEGTIRINCVAEGSNTVKSCTYKITGSNTGSGTLSSSPYSTSFRTKAGSYTVSSPSGGQVIDSGGNIVRVSTTTVSPESFSLAAGKEQVVTITLNYNEGVEDLESTITLNADISQFCVQTAKLNYTITSNKGFSTSGSLTPTKDDGVTTTINVPNGAIYTLSGSLYSKQCMSGYDDCSFSWYQFSPSKITIPATQLGGGSYSSDAQFAGEGCSGAQCNIVLQGGSCPSGGSVSAKVNIVGSNTGYNSYHTVACGATERVVVACGSAYNISASQDTSAGGPTVDVSVSPTSVSPSTSSPNSNVTISFAEKQNNCSITVMGETTVYKANVNVSLRKAGVQIDSGTLGAGCSQDNSLVFDNLECGADYLVVATSGSGLLCNAGQWYAMSNMSVDPQNVNSLSGDTYVTISGLEPEEFKSGEPLSGEYDGCTQSQINNACIP